MTMTSARAGTGARAQGPRLSPPALFVIDDDTGVVHALREDLLRRFGGDFRVIGESSAAAGLETLRSLAGSRDRVALLIVDHAMSEMSGVDFLARAHELHPPARSQGGSLAAMSDVPVFATGFVGRAQERADLGRLSAGSRLVTVIGPGGVGKTRLAAEAIRTWGARFPGGIWW